MSVDKESITLTFFSITLCSINHVDIDIKGTGILPRLGVLPHLTLSARGIHILTLEAPITTAADDSLEFFHCFTEKIRLDISREFSAI